MQITYHLACHLLGTETVKITSWILSDAQSKDRVNSPYLWICSWKSRWNCAGSVLCSISHLVLTKWKFQFLTDVKSNNMYICIYIYTGRFIMFSVITDIYNKKTKGPTLPHTRQHVDACVARTWISYRCVPCHPWCTHRTSLVVKKKTFPVFLWLWKTPLR